MEIAVKYKIKRNSIVRFFLCPLYNIHHHLEKFLFQFSQDKKKIQAFKGIHCGEKCFIIGNGPSLLATDLEALNNKNIVCFGVNRIYDIFDRTSWRPDYYFCTDITVIQNEREKICGNAKIYSFFHLKAKKYIGNMDNSCFFTEVFHNYVKWYRPQQYRVSEDVSECFYVSGTIALHAVQMAIYMGFKDIYFLGVDHNYKFQMDSNGKMTGDKFVQNSHFADCKDYGYEYYAHGAVSEAYEITKKYCDQAGIHIFNATRGGKLETFKRVDFYDVVK